MADLKTPPQFAGECIGVSLTNRGENDSHKIVSLFIEDDGNWHPKAAFSQHWLAEAIRVLQAAQAALATPAPGAPAGFKTVPVEPDGKMWSVGRDEFIRWAQNYEDARSAEKASIIGDIAGSDIFRAMVRAAPGAPGQEAAAVQAAWINVDEQLPEEGTTVACCAGGTPYLACLIFGKDASGEWVQTWTQDGEPEQQPRHWTPLPAPPAALPAGVLKGDEAP